jgi:hypothetical protein
MLVSRPLCSSQGTDGRCPALDAFHSRERWFDPGCSVRPRNDPLPQDPTACLGSSRRCRSFPAASSCTQMPAVGIDGPTGQRSTLEHHPWGECPRHGSGHGPKRGPRQMLLRKEVIQPHLPVRLPCYDFVPIADPTFDGSLLAVGPPASGVTDFRDVTGGVYKARERIHRSVADLRLLATPTSWGRVADPNPN